MAKMSISVEDLSILADNYPNKEAWQRVSFYDGELHIPEDFDPPISVVDMSSARKAALMSYARMKRWQIETGGITVSGMSIATDDRSKLMIAGARTSADADPDFETSWDAGSADISLNAQQIIVISDAVRDHVASVFSKFTTVRAGVGNGSLSSRADIDAAFAD